MPLDAEPNREPRAYSLSGNNAAAAMLRQEAFGNLAPAAGYGLRARALPVPLGWPGRLYERFAQQAVLAAAIAGAALLLALAVPVWLGLQGNGSTGAAPSVAVHSSAGVTGTAGTRVEELSAATFVGGIPFEQQLRYYDAATSSASQARLFVQGAREASVAEYLHTVGTRVALPYLNDAVGTKNDIERYTAAIAENARVARLKQAQAVTSTASWERPPVAGGTRLSSTVTFYACVGNGFCGHMATGENPFPGAAACSTNLPFGTRFTLANDPASRVFTCLDRGALAPTWVDIWFYDAADGWAWQALVGTHSEIIVLQ